MISAGQHAIRRNDYSLDEQQIAVQEMFTNFFRSVSPSEVVRAAAPTGFDAALWRTCVETGVVSMAVPESRGGDGATVVDLVLMAEQYGARLAPVPLVDAAVGARLLANLGGTTSDALLAEVIAGSEIPTVALAPVDGRSSRQLLSSGAVATFALVLRGDSVVCVRPPRNRVSVDTMSGSSAWWDMASTGEALGSGPDAVAAYDVAVRLWKLLTAAALVGSGQSAVDSAVDFATSRIAFGQPIGTFQAISHSLVDAATLVDASRNLTRKAAWFLEHEPAESLFLVPAAYVSARRAAVTASSTGVHVQGGFGFTEESDMTLHFRRAKGWPLLSGGPDVEIAAISSLLPLPPAI